MSERDDWYKDAVIYELHVRAFQDSDGDGVGDFCGLTARLDYLQALGVTALWLLPFFPSPLQDDGYDIADYTAVHPSYGSLDDFRDFLEAAHRRRMRVIVELVLNHTSDQHPWFQRARRAPKGSVERDFYVWSDSPERYAGARVIFQDYEHSNWAWDPLAEQYYWHRFYAHQPDLNFASPAVRAAIFEVVDFWLGLGVDGLRLDAVPYLYEAEGTPSENLTPTHAFLKELRAHIDERFPGRMLLAEANQWPEDAAAYFGDGDECHMAFHFPLMPRLFMALRSQDRFPIVDILAQTPALPDGAQWALFLRNHDELTLEMVTEEERIAMYRAYAGTPEARINLGIRRRLAPLLGNNRRQIELLYGLLCALPGTPVLYYGDEIGMGDNIYLGDRDGVRTPMQWSADRNAGFSPANPQRLYLPLITDYEYHHQALHVEAQEQNPHSLLHWVRRLLGLRRRYRAFGRGGLRFLDPENQRVLAFLRQHEGETILVVANLSRFFQHVALDLRDLAGLAPTELFGNSGMPPIGAEPYVLTLSPHAFHWFAVEPPRPDVRDPAEAAFVVPDLELRGGWEELFDGVGRADLEELLPAYLRAQPWFARKERAVLAARLIEAVALPDAPDGVRLALVSAEFADEPALYSLPLAYATGERAERLLRERPHAALARVRAPDGAAGLIYDSLATPEVAAAVVDLIVAQHSLPASTGTISATADDELRAAWQAARASLGPPAAFEDHNTTLRFGDAALLKLFRRLDEGVNPALEIGRYLNERGFPHTPRVAGVWSYARNHGVPITLALLEAVAGHERTAWEHLLGLLAEFYAAAAAAGGAPEQPRRARARGLLDIVAAPPAPAGPLDGPYLAVAALIGRRAAELHTLLAASEEPAFAPEPFTPLYQRSLYQSLRGTAGRVLRTLRASLGHLEPDARAAAERVIAAEGEILGRFTAVLAPGLRAMRTRVHGDFSLGELLWAGDDVVIVDFEGEPGRPLLERLLKHSPLWDIAAMVQSLAYAAQVALDRHGRTAELEPWAHAWHRAAAAAFIRAYLDTAGESSCLPGGRDGLEGLLDAYVLQKALYGLGRELNDRPDWVGVALRSLLQLLPEQA